MLIRLIKFQELKEKVKEIMVSFVGERNPQINLIYLIKDLKERLKRFGEESPWKTLAFLLCLESVLP